MNRRFWMLLLMAAVFAAPILAEAAKTTYVFTDRKFKSVKRVEVDKTTLKERQVNHPYTFTELQLRNMLGTLKYDKKVIFSKNDESEEVIFNQSSLDLLVPHLMTAFKDLQPHEEVIISFVTHKPKLLVRDDRLTIAKMWVEGDRLHIYFRKLMAKISNDYDKMSDVNIAISRAQGVRVSVLAQPGQEFGRSKDEVLLAIPDAGAVAAAEIETPATKTETVKEEAPAKKTEPSPLTTTATPPPANAEGRLQQLDNLKKKGLINKDEYQKKREEILNTL